MGADATRGGAARVGQRTVLDAFVEQHGEAAPLVARAPGRVNLIGEHTDYNDGFVLPMAIDRAIWIALRPRSDDRVVIRSLDFREERSFDLRAMEHRGGGWIDYVQGVAWALQRSGLRPRGWEGLAAGDVPIGAGLSSSAAVEMAAARAFAAVSDFAWNAKLMALAGQQAENDWVGVSSGIMDQMISAMGQAGHALLIDCRSLRTSSLPIPAGTDVVIMDTGTRRELVDSAYNERHAQCEAAAASLGVAALRDVMLSELQGAVDWLDPRTFRRARHVVTENARTQQAAEALKRADVESFGKLMSASHASLRDDFEVSGPELDLLVNLAELQEGCYGARMTGAGFGGCAVALVATANAESFVNEVSRAYGERSDFTARLYVCSPAAGASITRTRKASNGEHHGRSVGS